MFTFSAPSHVLLQLFANYVTHVTLQNAASYE